MDNRGRQSDDGRIPVRVQKDRRASCLHLSLVLSKVIGYSQYVTDRIFVHLYVHAVG